jgi:hypothetical protein
MLYLGDFWYRKEVKRMKTSMALVLVLAMVFGATSFSLAAGWDSCKGCHTDAGKPAPSKADLVKKYKTAAELIKAAKAAKNPMMNNFKKDELLKAATKDIGLK